MLTRLKYFCVIGLLMFGLISSASTATCKTNISSTVYGSTPYLTTTEALGPFTINCNGGFGGSLKNLSSAWLNLRLEKFENGAWGGVSSGYYISYGGTPGTYRYTVVNSGNGNGTWSVTYNHPVY